MPCLSIRRSLYGGWYLRIGRRQRLMHINLTTGWL